MVKIDKISMTGFRGATAPVEVTFDKSKPVILIFGENGTGKSTIADAFDFLCNSSYGSLSNYSLGAGESAKKHIASVGAKTSDVSVTLVSGNTTWMATLGSDGPVVTPRDGCPDARILRRRTILSLIEAQPKQRFETLKAFIAVPNIEKAENALREAVRTTENSVNERSRALAQTEGDLEKLWVAEGKPSKSALEWVGAEASKDISALQANLNAFKSLEQAYQEAENALRELDHTQQRQQQSQSMFAEAEQKQKTAESRQSQQSGELLKLLQDARSYIDKKHPVSHCPVCEQSIDAVGLGQQLRTRIDEMQQLNTLT